MNNISNLIKDQFGWEIPVENVPLPSNGLIYSPDSLLYGKDSLQIKAMTAHEEDILASQSYIKDGVTIKKLIESCLIEKNLDVDDLITGDKNALMVSIRITGYGSDYNVTHHCESCQNKNKVEIDLTSLGIKRFNQEPLEKGKNLFSFTLPVTGKKVIYKYLTGKDEKERVITNKRLQKLGVDTSQNTITKFLEDVIVSIDNVTDPVAIQHFIKSMPAMDSRKLRIAIKDNEPGIDMTWNYQCDICGHQNNIIMPINSEFFWPNS